MRLLVLGAGAVGGYFGGRLAEAGVDVTFLVRPKRRDELDRQGLRIESPLGDIHIPVRAILAESLRPDYDLVLFTCKAYDLESAVDAITPAMQGSCAVLPLLNGLAHFDVLDDRFGAANVMGGSCHIDVTLHPDAVIRHGGTLQRLTFGERDRRPSERAQKLAAILGRTRIDWELSDDVERSLWEKLVFLCVLAGMTSLFRGNVREIMAAPGGREAMIQSLDAAIAVATHEGHPPSQDAVDFARERLTDTTGAWSASMMRDVEAGRPTEADPIIGWMLERARRHGVEARALALAYTHLKTYEARRAAGRLSGSTV